ncbi:phosphate ABC transporter permease subunit PstC [Fimbriimonas ginsengisoli]|uniref:Phosphate transport system permease protein n=1 Tax=Fimbriimonas ginsengisoli Gsoil 348 TaxID=661478 RepID=A0A068NUK0_FIMGI|nr:phosphate ABC transporter permease subunit PstC [Fimbriimonas ginsengisoli]AIE85294.1 phosphate ABC transporter, inner membrane subunit PstC [Fimbriimonas ginsengisoli Gsoil 348]
MPTTAQQTIVAVAEKPWRRSLGARGIRQGIVRWFCFAAALVSVATTFGIVTVLLTQSWPFFQHVSLASFFGGTVWKPTTSPPSFGILPLITGTLMITVGAGLVALPLGLLSAIFMSEYAPKRVRGILKPALELLAGIPTVVYGYFGLFFVTPLLRHVLPSIQSSNALSGAVVVGIMILPLVSSLCEDALAAVPRALREGAYGLGSTKMEVTTRIVVPAALSGIMASFILALSRALGETMAVTLAAGANPQLTLNPAKSIETMTAYIVNTSKGDISTTGLVFPSLFAVGATLFAITMVMNLIAQRLVKRFRQVYA